MALWSVPQSRMVIFNSSFIGAFLLLSAATIFTSSQYLLSFIMGQPRMPVYFLSIGGPNTIENTQHPAYLKLGQIGQEIVSNVKPKAVVVFSAHWQDDTPNRVQVNTAEHADIIYDFYGFPTRYYEIKYPSQGSSELANKIIEKLANAGIHAKGVSRGLDHGVWVGFRAAFNPDTNPLGVPLVQVSLLQSEDPDEHYRLGAVLEGLRDDGVLIIGAGMAVHNLNDFRTMMRSGKVETKLYASSFDNALEEAVVSAPEVRQLKMSTLAKSLAAGEAHPTLEHLLPIYICAGAAGKDTGKRLWTFAEGSLNWAQYRFG